ncbi:MAG: hypothetical protein Q7J03_06490 [Methanoregula sp.]|nr:hypothetical protein [Methanoregula sp.]
MQNNNPKNNCASVPFRTIAHFYDPDDPTPENNRELSDRAENEIFHEVLAVTKGDHDGMCRNIEIVLPTSELTPERQTAIISAVRSHFRLRAGKVQRDMKLTQMVGLREFRLTVAVCLPSFIGIAICSQFKGDPIVEVVENVLVIFCWVTIWQPFQSLVFDRWTLSKTADVYRKIAEMEIQVKAG